MRKQTTTSIFFIIALLFSLPCLARIVTTEPIICQDNIKELQQNASTAYLVKLSNVEYGGKPDSLTVIGPNGILYSPAQITILKIYRDPTGKLATLQNTPQKATLARVCDSLHNEHNGNCWALQMTFEDEQRWVLFDTPTTDGQIDFTLRDCPAASFLVESDEQLKAWEKQYTPAH